MKRSGSSWTASSSIPFHSLVACKIGPGLLLSQVLLLLLFAARASKYWAVVTLLEGRGFLGTLLMLHPTHKWHRWGEDWQIGGKIPDPSCEVSIQLTWLLKIHNDLLAFLGQAFLVHSVCPDALDDLKYLVSDVEFVVELSVCSCWFHLLGFISNYIDQSEVSYVRALPM